MRRRGYRKFAAVLLAAAMLFQQTGIQTAAEENAAVQTAEVQQAEAAPEAQTQEPTELQTQAPTEPQTQAPTEPQTQAPTEPQTQEPTEPQTQAPTEPQTQEPTEPQTQAPTEPQTQAPTEEPETETSGKKEKETEEETEEKTEETTETERAERVNDGAKMTAAALTAGLQGALPYLFAAGTVEGPEEILENLEIADGAQGQAIVSSLTDFSVNLANARSSSDVAVINIYADEKGNLDASQLEKVFQNRVIDVTKQYYVVNIIADHKTQNLQFSGYEMVLSGQRVQYEKTSQPGDILYNFAAMDGERFTDYEGTVTLSTSSGLQGTFLAPKASVQINSGLAGAVYAGQIQVAQNAGDLLQIVLIEGRTDMTASESETEESEPNTEDGVESEGQTGVQEPAGEPAPQDETKVPDGEGLSVEETEEVTEAASNGAEDEETETVIETAENAESESELASEETEEVVDLADYMAGEDASTFLESGTSLRISISDAAGTAISGSGAVSVKAAAEIKDSEDAVKYAKDEEVISVPFSESTCSFGVGEHLAYTGAYYLEIKVPAGYLAVPRVYFTVDSQGNVSSDAAGWNPIGNELAISLHQTALEGVPVLASVKDAADGSSVNADFVIKNSAGEVLGGTDYPGYYVQYTGTAVALSGLPDGTYYLSQIKAQDGYQIAEDKMFTVPADEKSGSMEITNEKYPQDGKTITVSAEAICNNTVLTAEKEVGYYAALFSDEGLTKRVSEVKTLSFTSGTAKTQNVSFRGVKGGTAYYLAATDEFGQLLSDQKYKLCDASGNPLKDQKMAVTVAQNESEKQVALRFGYDTADYPSGTFSYEVQLSLTLEVKDRQGKAAAVKENFYVNLYQDAALTKKLNSSKIRFAMNQEASLTVPYTLKMTEGEAEYYIAEVDKNGTVITPDMDFAYGITYPDHLDGKFTVTCGERPQIVIQNKLNESIVKLWVEDEASGASLSGAVLVLKNSKGKVIAVNNAKTFESQSAGIVWTNLLEDGATYYLSEVKAPSGYTPGPDVKFKVQKGVTTEVVLKNSATVASDYKLTVSKQVYSGEHPVYAYDTTNGTYAAEGRYTFYAALFSDAAHTKKVSDVQAITVKALGGTTTFRNLKHNGTYYVAETDEYGVPLASGSGCTINYADNGKVHMSEKNRTTVIQNVYSSLPRGYRYTASLTIAVNVTGTSGAAEAVTESFYVGIYRNADYSDTPTVIKLDLNNASSSSVKRRILLSGNNDMTYYIAELDASGNRIANSSDFSYTVSIDQPTVTVTKSSNQTVTITNKVKASKVTLYLTKKVYEGSEPKAVNETFYAGLFKDEGFTKLYTNPVPMQMNGKSELTLKLSLNLGSASQATIYIAEVDAQGNLIENQQAFGYEIKLVNSTAAFTQDRLEVQTILYNTVYGTATDDDWNNIFSRDGIGSGSGAIADNGFASSADGYDGTSSVQTGDGTPVAGYSILLLGSAVLFAGLYKRKRRYH